MPTTALVKFERPDGSAFVHLAGNGSPEGDHGFLRILARALVDNDAAAGLPAFNAWALSGSFTDRVDAAMRVAGVHAARAPAQWGYLVRRAGREGAPRPHALHVAVRAPVRAGRTTRWPTVAGFLVWRWNEKPPRQDGDTAHGLDAAVLDELDENHRAALAQAWGECPPWLGEPHARDYPGAITALDGVERGLSGHDAQTLARAWVRNRRAMAAERLDNGTARGQPRRRRATA